MSSKYVQEIAENSSGRNFLGHFYSEILPEENISFLNENQKIFALKLQSYKLIYRVG